MPCRPVLTRPGPALWALFAVSVPLFQEVFQRHGHTVAQVCTLCPVIFRNPHPEYGVLGRSR